MRPSTGFTDRLKRARLWAGYQGGAELDQPALGARAATAIGRGEPFGQTTVSAWFRVGVRDADTIWGIAQACGVRAAWLAFGEEPMVAAAGVAVDDDGIPEAVRDLPRITPVDRARPLTDDVIEELQREAAGAPPARKAATAKARRRK